MSKRTLSRLGRVVLAASLGVVVLIGVLSGIGRMEDERATAVDAPSDRVADGKVLADPPAAEPLMVALSGGTNLATSSELEVTQKFSLRAGWNAIYLEVEPRNTSPMVQVDLDGDGNPIMERALSTVESVFNPISTSLVAVWEWRTPVSTKDFIADPSEGLWDEPGWRKYYPGTSPGPDGESREFLNDLINLHAGRGYLVEMTTTLGTPALLEVVGDPELRRPRREVGAYNLGGFPIEPSVSPDMNGYLVPLPVDELYEIKPDGTWLKTWTRSGGNAFPTSTLKYGEGYLLKAKEAGSTGSPDLFTKNGLLDIEASDSRLIFDDRVAALVTEQRVTVRNRGPAAANVSVSRLASAVPVELELEEPASTWTAVNGSAITVNVPASSTRDLKFRVRAGAQVKDGASLIQIASTALGTRWLIPTSVSSPNRLGLWVGDVYVTEVSEGRAGSTNVDEAKLAIGLRAFSDSGIRGGIQLTELTATNATSMVFTLELPEPVIVRPTGEDAPVAPSVGGWFFEDRSANGRYDGNEPGFEGITVTLTGPATLNTATRSDGSWFVDNGGTGMADGDYVITYAVPNTMTLMSMTQDFTVTEPPTMETGASLPTPVPGATATSTPASVTRPNHWPVEVSLSGGKIDEYKVKNTAGTETTLTPPLDVNGDPDSVSLDFGWVTEYDAFLANGTCSNVTGGTESSLGVVKNGTLEVARASTVIRQPLAAGPTWLLDTVNPFLIRLKKKPPPTSPDVVACGEIRVGMPVAGSFQYRVIMRVEEETAGATTFKTAELLPYYITAQDNRVSAINTSIVKPVKRTGTSNFAQGETVEFNVTVDPRDPRNPFKHKYHPDLDNLDVKFNPIDLGQVPPYLWEVPEIRRRMKFTLSASVPSELNQTAEVLGWGGTVWGGQYEEIIKGVHKHDLTVRGYFLARRVRTADQVAAETQDFD